MMLEIYKVNHGIISSFSLLIFFFYWLRFSSLIFYITSLSPLNIDNTERKVFFLNENSIFELPFITSCHIFISLIFVSLFNFLKMRHDEENCENKRKSMLNEEILSISCLNWINFPTPLSMMKCSKTMRNLNFYVNDIQFKREFRRIQWIVKPHHEWEESLINESAIKKIPNFLLIIKPKQRRTESKTSTFSPCIWNDIKTWYAFNTEW